MVSPFQSNIDAWREDVNASFHLLRNQRTNNLSSQRWLTQNGRGCDALFARKEPYRSQFLAPGKISAMRVASGRVVDGHVELTAAELPEGAAVTFEADPETERMLLESIAQCERGEGVPIETVLAELCRRR